MTNTTERDKVVKAAADVLVREVELLGDVISEADAQRIVALIFATIREGISDLVRRKQK